MLYILVFTRVSYHFDCCMIFDVVLALYQRCSFRLVGQCESLYSVERVTEVAPRFFSMYT